jgi:acetyl esterase/lipase
VVASLGQLNRVLAECPQPAHPGAAQVHGRALSGEQFDRRSRRSTSSLRARCSARCERGGAHIHGGAFDGRPKSHRRLTTKFSEITGGAVLAIDYRLMPENRRMDGIGDCRTAYRWLLENGPDGRSPATKVWVAGDSAGGNLTLSLIAWVRDAGLRPPDAGCAFADHGRDCAARA